MNFLLINADQLRHDCLGYTGIRDVKTPNIDALARAGVVFTRAFTPVPVCAPARQALLCGRHPDSFGAQWNYDFISTPTARPEWCWPRLLREKGYKTAYLGRFHVSPDYTPRDFGYDVWVNREDYNEYINKKYPDITYTGGWLGCTSPVPLDCSATHWLAGKTVELLEKFSQTGEPWHIWLDFEEPHLPCRPSEPFASMYNPEDIPPWDGFYDNFVNKPYCHKQQMINWGLENMDWDDIAPMVARYFGVISQLDDALGKIFNALQEYGQSDNTVVVFTSDHGDMCGSHHMLDKHYVLYDDITRVPLIVRHPKASPRIRSDFVSNCLDIPASVREWFELEKDKNAHGMPLPIFNNNYEPREFIVSTSNGQQFGLYTTRMLRGDRYKYIWNLTDTDELYDMKADLGELRNLIADDRLSELISVMRNEMAFQLYLHGDPFIRGEFMERQLTEGKKWTRTQ